MLEPNKEFYHEDQHDAIKEVIKSRFAEQVTCENKVEEIEDLVKKFGDGIQCEHCGIKLMEAEITRKKIEQLDSYKRLVEEFKEEIKKHEEKEQSFTQLKKDFDEYEKNKLIKEKYEVSLESNELRLGQAKDKLKRYEEVQDKIKKNQLVFSNRRIAEEDEERPVLATLNEEKIQEALDLMAEKYPRHYKDFVDENEDADTGDVFIQLFVFGEVIYG